jgi:predicted short-subunit dehydrogenase-like oxidoreductase (DUF2520 family)
LRVAGALRELPLVVDAVLEGVLSQEQAGVLSRLVGRIDAGALRESQPNLIAVATGMDPVQLGGGSRTRSRRTASRRSTTTRPRAGAAAPDHAAGR